MIVDNLLDVARTEETHSNRRMIGCSVGAELRRLRNIWRKLENTEADCRREQRRNVLRRNRVTHKTTPVVVVLRDEANGARAGQNESIGGAGAVACGALERDAVE